MASAQVRRSSRRSLLSCKANRYLEGNSKRHRDQLQRFQNVLPGCPSQESPQPQEAAAAGDISADSEQRQAQVALEAAGLGTLRHTGRTTSAAPAAGASRERGQTPAVPGAMSHSATQLWGSSRGPAAAAAHRAHSRVCVNQQGGPH